jgi:hypothetical protein
MDISPSRTGLLAQTFWRSPGSRAHCFLTCWGSSTTPSPAAARELTRFAGVAFPLTEKGRHSDCSFRSSMARPPVPLSTLQLSPSRATVQDSRPEWSRFSFSVGLSHPLQCAGLARRSPSPISLSPVLTRSKPTATPAITCPATGIAVPRDFAIPTAPSPSVTAVFQVLNSGSAATVLLTRLRRQSRRWRSQS